MRSRSYAQKAIRPGMTVRQIAADFPASQEVFRAYGEQDAPPSRFGHLEPLTSFARRQGVPVEKLLCELKAATAVPIANGSRFAERVHHGFVLAALFVTLTFGAGWGAWLLWQIGVQGDFAGVPAAYVVAHGEAQMWGFLVLFVMGVSLRTALQGVARIPGGRWICTGMLSVALAGIAGSLLWSVWPEGTAAIGLGSAGLLCVLALSYWCVQIVMLRRKWRATWARAILASGLWLSVWGAVTLWLRWTVGDAGPGLYRDSERLLLIQLAVLGFGMNSIYGFGQMLLPGLLRTGSPHEGAIEAGHWLHNAGVVVATLASAGAAGGWGQIAASGLLTGGAVLFAAGHRGFVGRQRTSGGAEKGHAALDFYPPLAFCWLLAALALMTGGAIYESITAGPMPHAYAGAMRHALTVGFMTTLILGVGQRLIPVLDRTVLAMPGWSVAILALIGLGNLWRVLSELAVLATPAMSRMMPLSAVLELSALLLFAMNLVATMFHRDPLLRTGRVTEGSSLAVLLAGHPWIEDRLRPTGTGYLLRTRSVPDELTIGSFAASEGFDAARFVATVNAWLAEGPPTTTPDPLVSRPGLAAEPGEVRPAAAVVQSADTAAAER